MKLRAHLLTILFFISFYAFLRIEYLYPDILIWVVLTGAVALFYWLIYHGIKLHLKNKETPK